MFHYRILEHIVRSNIAFGLAPVAIQVPEYIFQLQDSVQENLPSIWILDYKIDNLQPWLRLGKTYSEYFLRFVDDADFKINFEQKKIYCDPTPGTTTNTIEHLLLDQVLPRILAHKGYLVFHAGAVASEMGILGFVGKTGSGKSTLTASLGRLGWPVLTDDCLALYSDKNQYIALPSYPGVRLWPDAADALVGTTVSLPAVAGYTRKVRISPDQGGHWFHDKQTPLKALFVLSTTDDTTAEEQVILEQLTPREAFISVFEEIFRLDPTDHNYIRNEMDRLSHFVENTPVYRLSYSRRHTIFSKVQSRLRSLFA